MRDFNEENYLFELFIEYERKRLYKLEILLSCFAMYMTKLSIHKPLLALPAPKNSKQENKEEKDKLNELPEILAEKEKTIEEPREQEENQTLKNIAGLLENTTENEEVFEPTILEQEHIEPNDLIITNLINRFLKLFFKYKESNLNYRAKSEVDRVYGYFYWDKKQVARHLVSKDYSKILNDKYDVEYGKGKRENIPLALYFDLSPSMEKYYSIAADIALVLLKNDIRVLIGYNSTINYQIDSIGRKATSEDLKEFFGVKRHSQIKSEVINEDISSYLSRKKCERCIVISDSDSYSSVCELSENCEIYLLYCLNYKREVDNNFKGAYFNINSEEDLMNALLEMSKSDYRILKAKNKTRKRSR